MVPAQDATLVTPMVLLLACASWSAGTGTGTGTGIAQVQVQAPVNALVETHRCRCGMSLYLHCIFTIRIRITCTGTAMCIGIMSSIGTQKRHSGLPHAMHTKQSQHRPDAPAFDAFEGAFPTSQTLPINVAHVHEHVHVAWVRVRMGLLPFTGLLPLCVTHALALDQALIAYSDLSSVKIAFTSA